MSTTRPFVCDDLLAFNSVNLDVLTETVRPVGQLATSTLRSLTPLRRHLPQYNMNFYGEYLSKWPDMFTYQESPGQRPISYSACASEGIYSPVVH